MQYPHITSKFSLALTNISRANTAKHLKANEFLVDFAVVIRSKVQTLQDSARRNTQKFIALRRLSSTLFSYTRLGSVFLLKTPVLPQKVPERVVYG